MCAFSLPVSKTNAAVFDNRGICATLISNQGHRADMGRFRPVCEKRHESHRLAVADTVTLLNHLAREGHKVSLTKLQFVKQEIIFLGHTNTKQ